MSKNLDDQIRELFARVDGVAPEPPEFQVPDAPPFPWVRYVMLPAAAVFVFVLGTAVVLDAVGVDLGLGASGDTTEDTIPDQRDDDLVLLLLDLNLACEDLMAAKELTPGGASDGAALRTLTAYTTILEVFDADVSAAVDRVGVPESLVDVAGGIADLRDDVATAVSLGSEGASARLSAVDDALASLGEELAAEGAATCADM